MASPASYQGSARVLRCFGPALAANVSRTDQDNGPKGKGSSGPFFGPSTQGSRTKWHKNRPGTSSKRTGILNKEPSVLLTCRGPGDQSAAVAGAPGDAASLVLGRIHRTPVRQHRQRTSGRLTNPPQGHTGWLPPLQLVVSSHKSVLKVSSVESTGRFLRLCAPWK